MGSPTAPSGIEGGLHLYSTMEGLSSVKEEAGLGYGSEWGSEFGKFPDIFPTFLGQVWGGPGILGLVREFCGYLWG